MKWYAQNEDRDQSLALHLLMQEVLLLYEFGVTRICMMHKRGYLTSFWEGIETNNFLQVWLQTRCAFMLV